MWLEWYYFSVWLVFQKSKFVGSRLENLFELITLAEIIFFFLLLT